MRHTLICILLSLSSFFPVFAENLLINPDFEGAHGWIVYESAGIRETWRSRSGSFNAGLMGQWSDAGLNGMIEQREIPVIAGQAYLFSVWLWGDLGWRPYEQYLKIIFFDDDLQVLCEERKLLTGIHPMWSQVKLRVSAPAYAASASICIGASGVSSYGALTIDDVYFGQIDEVVAIRP